MLTKTKNICKKSKKNFFFFKMKKKFGHMAQEKPQMKFERNPCSNSEIIDATDGRTTDDRRRTNFDFMSSADIAQLKLFNEF